NIENRLASPSLHFLMGTDPLGRDLFSRVLVGARVSLTVGIITAFLSIFLGTIFGAIAGYFNSDRMMRVVDLFYMLPSLLLAILFVSLFGKSGTNLWPVLLALGAVSWMNQARL